MRRVAAVLAVVLAAGGCVGPSRTDADYRAKAANTAEAVRSSVGTARLGIDAAGERRVTGPYLTRLLAEAEEDALAAQASFDSVQPPSERADAVHDDLDELLTKALDALRALRIAVRRGDLDHLGDLGAGLAEVDEALERFPS
jgi:hypothetical protein